MQPITKILDACCGSKMFWFDKHHPQAIYLDCRKETIEFQGFKSEVDPDIVADFTSLPFPDNSFSLVVFDPPHLTWAGPKSWLRAKYGVLEETWPNMIHDGFTECFRVLKPDGILIFKWSEVQIPLKEVLACTDHKPLFGNHKPWQSKTHWICFMKDGSDDYGASLKASGFRSDGQAGGKFWTGERQKTGDQERQNQK